MTITIETKFSKGDEVWYISESQSSDIQIHRDEVSGIDLTPKPPGFDISYKTMLATNLKKEYELFATQQELIDYLTHPANIQQIDHRLKSRPA